MKSKECISRFCFTLKDMSAKELVSLFEIIVKEKPAIQSMEAFKVFENDTFTFIILNVDHQFDLITFKKYLENQLEKRKQVKFIEDFIHSEELQPLERIFKMNSEENQIVKKKHNFKRVVMTLELNADKGLIEAYKEVHKKENIWPQIIDNMKTIGVKDMEIYIDGFQVFLIMDTTLSFNMQKDGEKWENLPREKEWQAYVAKFQKVDPNNNATEKWVTMNTLIIK